MGYDSERFVGNVDDEFHCPICLMIFENPIETPCDHTFCNECLIQWLSINAGCPIDRTEFRVNELTTPSRLFLSLLAKLNIKCDFAECDAVVELAHLQNHVDNCKLNPNAEIVCVKGCARIGRRCEQQRHDCLAHLSSLIDGQAAEITKLTSEAFQRERTIAGLKATEQKQNDEIARSSNSLRRLEEDMTKVTSENSRLKREILSLKELKDEIRHSSYRIDVRNPSLKWKLDEGLRFYEPLNVLERVGGPDGGLCAFSYESLGAKKNSFKFEVVSLKNSIWIRLNISLDCITKFAGLTHSTSVDYYEKFEVGDVIECGIKDPEKWNGNASAKIVVYYKRNGCYSKWNEKSVDVKPNYKLFPVIIFGGIGDKLKILIN